MSRTLRTASWGRYPREPQSLLPLAWAQDPLPEVGGASLLPYGLGRSYGDSCLNTGGVLLGARPLDRFLEFDPALGILRAEAGVTLDEILRLVVPRGWFLPVTPGTRFVTLGGAIANDVHGKNHHRSGCFGSHVTGLELLRSDGSRRFCSPAENADWFAATVGGLGLTGVITWCEIRLRQVAGPWLETETVRFGSLAEFLRLAAESDGTWEYTVAWLDCLARGRSLGRGLFLRGNHDPAPARGYERDRPPRLRVPFAPPVSLVNGLSVRLFNQVYYHRPVGASRPKRTHYRPFFYPLDAVLDWNRIYGRRGFFQYQCVVPPATAEPALREIIERIAASGQGSFLAVLKVFGEQPSPGMLSFPRPGATLALDFAHRGATTLQLFKRLDEVVLRAGGAVYPAKDARMSGAVFRTGFPRWEEFSRFIDPRFSSDFWRRVTGGFHA